MARKPRLPDPASAGEGDVAALAATLDARYGHLPAQEVIAVAIDLFREDGGIAAVSSFGADSAALLHMIAEADATCRSAFSTPASILVKRSAIATSLPRIWA